MTRTLSNRLRKVETRLMPRVNPRYRDVVLWLPNNQREIPGTFWVNTVTGEKALEPALRAGGRDA